MASPPCINVASLLLRSPWGLSLSLSLSVLETTSAARRAVGLERSWDCVREEGCDQAGAAFGSKRRDEGESLNEGGEGARPIVITGWDRNTRRFRGRKGKGKRDKERHPIV
jgi:hypothetical protein